MIRRRIGRNGTKRHSTLEWRVRFWNMQARPVRCYTSFNVPLYLTVLSFQIAHRKQHRPRPLHQSHHPLFRAPCPLSMAHRLVVTPLLFTPGKQPSPLQKQIIVHSQLRPRHCYPYRAPGNASTLPIHAPFIILKIRTMRTIILATSAVTDHCLGIPYPQMMQYAPNDNEHPGLSPALLPGLLLPTRPREMEQTHPPCPPL